MGDKEKKHWYPHLVARFGEEHQQLVEDLAVVRGTTVESLMADEARLRLRRQLDGD